MSNVKAMQILEPYPHANSVLSADSISGQRDQHSVQMDDYRETKGRGSLPQELFCRDLRQCRTFS
jgi:hypothetical protein